MPTDRQPSVAVIGAGVSGLTAAHLLSRTHQVTLYEAEARLGGHAHTHDIVDQTGSALAIDTGFIVHNDRTYPLLRRLFDELGVRTRATEMSMSIQVPETGLEFAGGRGVRGIFAQPRRLIDPRFLHLLTQVRRFHRSATHFLETTADDDVTTFGDFLTAQGFSADFRRSYAIPLVSCVWSSSPRGAVGYPARYLFQFLHRHGMLSISGSPTWFTVSGGSRHYVDAIAHGAVGHRTSNPVRTVRRQDGGAVIIDEADNAQTYDRVVLATHADQALRLLSDATPAEKETLGAFTYAHNETILHTDVRLLPRARQARASWNYVSPGVGSGPTTPSPNDHAESPSHDHPPMVTYWMNRLQGLVSVDQFLVTLNGRSHIDPDRIVETMNYRHPIFTAESVRAQRDLERLTTEQTAYAGAYHGWGFHEDGCRSGVAVARRWGVDW